MILTLIATVFVLGVLIFVHETGHFLSAKIFKMRVERFSLGYPPRMIGKKVGDTDYCISWIPFGGYVKIAGMVDESFDTKSLANPPQPWEYRSRPWYQRYLVILAGPFMNILFTFLVFWAAILLYGVAQPSRGTVIGDMIKDYPAYEAGLRPGDKILAINQQPVEKWQEVQTLIREGGEGGITLRLSRKDSVFNAVITPVFEQDPTEPGTATVPKVGILPQFSQERVGFLRSFAEAGRSVYDLTELIVVSVYRLITGQESIKNVAGPVGIARMAGDYARAGFGALLAFMALLSLNLAILNLLPIPVLDGGHLTLLIIEGVIRREIPIRVKLVIQQIGMILLLALMLYVIYNDVLKVVK